MRLLSSLLLAVVISGLHSLATAPADQPLTQDDITLLLLGSTPSAKIIDAVELRGIDFQMDADLAKKFRDQGAHDDLIDALQKAANKAAAAKVSAPAAPTAPAPAAAPSNVGGANAQSRETAGSKPDDFEAHFRRGVALSDKGDVDGAIAELREAVRLKPDSIQAHEYLSRALVRNGDSAGAFAEIQETGRLRSSGLDQGIAQAREALRLKPNDPEAHYRLGTLLYQKIDFDGSNTEFREAVRLKPDFPEAHYRLGVGLEGKGDVDGAIAEYREAVRLKPDFPEAHNSLSSALMRKGNVDGANAEEREASHLKIARAREAVRLKPNDPQAHYTLGLALTQDNHNDWDGAIAEFREALRLNPNYIQAHYSLIATYQLKSGETRRLPMFTEAVSFSADGRSLATTSGALGAMGVSVWDVQAGRVQLRRSISVVGVTSLAFHPNGRWLASVQGIENPVSLWDTTTFPHRLVGQPMRLENTVKLWDTTTGSELHALYGHKSGIYAVAFIRDGRVAASLSLDGMLKLWDSASGRELRTIQLGGDILSASFSPNGSLLAARGIDPEDATIKLWDVAEGRELRSIPAGMGRAMALSPDGTLLAQADRSAAAIRILEVATGRELHRLTLGGKPDVVDSLTFSPNGRWLASVQALIPPSPANPGGTSPHVVHLWEVDTGREALRLPSTGGAAFVQGSGASTFLPGVAFSPDGQWLASTAGALFGIAAPRELPGGRSELALQTGSASTVNRLAFRNDGRVLASASSEHDLRLWDANTGQTVQTLAGAWNPPGGFVLSPDGRLLATEDMGNTITLWDTETAKELRTFTIPSITPQKGSFVGIMSLAFSPDAKMLAAGSLGKVVMLEAGTGRELRTLVTGTIPTRDEIPLPYVVTTLAFSSDGRRLVSIEGKAMQLWDTTTGERLAEHTEEQQVLQMFSGVLSADARWLAVLRSKPPDNRLQLVLYDASTLREVRSLPGPELSYPGALALSPDGRLLAGIQLSPDGIRAAFWDTSTGQVVRTFPLYPGGHIPGGILTPVLAFSKDGQWLATVPPGAETSIDLWEVSTGRRTRTIAGLPVRSFEFQQPPAEAHGDAPDHQ